MKRKNKNFKTTQNVMLPSLDGRVIIECVMPEIDAGMSAPKRIEGEPNIIEADVYSVGHDVIDCDLLWRRNGEVGWSREVMKQVENDIWRAKIPPQHRGKIEFTIEAWRDPFATLIFDSKKKLDFGQKISLELLELKNILEATQATKPQQLLAKLRDGLSPEDQLAILA